MRVVYARISSWRFRPRKTGMRVVYAWLLATPRRHVLPVNRSMALAADTAALRCALESVIDHAQRASSTAA
jgi:hypothetical protein